jgi:two-component system, OmpR family, sensor kinase
MGRLFWKFFLFLFFAQLTTTLGVGAAIWVHSTEYNEVGLEASRHAKSLVAAAASTMQFGGLEAMKEVLDVWQKETMPQVYVVDAQGQDVLQRNLPRTTLQAARKLESEHSSGHVVRSVKTQDGQQYLIFVPAMSRRMQGEPPAMGGAYSRPPPPPAGSAGMAPPPPDGPSGMGPPPDDGEPGARLFPIFPFGPMIAGVLASFIFAGLLAWYFSKPIKHLRAAFTEAANGQLGIRVGERMGQRRDELSDLGRDFDIMATRLGSLLLGQTRLLHYVSHELRSPLARLQMATGLARQNPEKIASSLDRIERESMLMDKLVGELLELSKLESGVLNINKEQVDFKELLLNVVEDAQYEADSKQSKVNLSISSNVIVAAQPDLLHRAIENVVRNAIKYGPVMSQISVFTVLTENAKQVHLQVIDQGRGVPENELESIFQPFVRGTSSAGVDGHGVGLAIAKQVIEAHGGSIRANNTAAGFEVSIYLPIVRVAPVV